MAAVTLPRSRRAVLGIAIVMLLAVSAQAAALALPSRLPVSERVKLQEFTDAAAISTRVEAPPFPARRDLFEYLLDHPEFATHVTRTLRLARYRIWRTPEGLFLDDGWGAKGHLEVVHAASGIRVMRVRGIFEQRILPDITGEAVVIVEYSARQDGQGRNQIATAVSGYVKIDNPVFAVASRLVNSVAVDKAELEARRLVRVFARTTHAVEDNPADLYQKLRQRPDVPRADLEGFRRLLRLP